MKDPDHLVIPALTALDDRVCETHEPPHQEQGLFRVSWPDLVDNPASLGLQVVDKGFSLLPVDCALGIGDAGQPLCDRPPGLLRALCARQFQTQLALGRRIPAADLDQQLRQALGA